MGETDAGGMRQHVVSHWRIWGLIVVVRVRRSRCNAPRAWMNKLR
jgi:hypothetical protein